MAGIARRVLSALVPKKIMDTNGQLLDALQKNSETLQNITDQFVPLMKRFRIFFFWEQEKTHLAHTNDYVVDEASAAPILDGTDRSGVAASHSQMCKFDSPSSGGYRTALAAIMRYVRSAPATIDTRTVQAAEMLQRLRSQEAQELTAGL
ncbi:MAG: hypothetical protein OHK93_001530 [Ramalina farinacea]|uniref:Uncharacterized protein n=1 Tax=Ramalina farinacea TaxID=258253 RepID=A0AA43QPQ6_9LECA|nr:hypothetical protein [Ramalina farinacea]